MKEIYLVRHAESASNAGQRTDSHDAIPLSELGKEQARIFAETFSEVPDLIVLSPYLRTRETAGPFISKHPRAIVETWDVHEFTYMDPKIYNGTTAKERADPAKKYWEHASVHHKDGEGESFAELTKRIEAFIAKLRARKESRIVIFTHGRFMLAVKYYLETVKKLGREELTDEELQALKGRHAAGFLSGEKFPIENVSVHSIGI